MRDIRKKQILIILCLTIIFLFSSFFLFSCTKSKQNNKQKEQKENNTEVISRFEQEVIKYNQQKKEFANRNFEERESDQINKISIKAQLITIDSKDMKHYVEADDETILDYAIERMSRGERVYRLNFILDITQKEYAKLIKTNAKRYNELIENIDIKYTINKADKYIYERENIGLSEKKSKTSRYLKLVPPVLRSDKNILPNNDEIYLYTLFNRQIKYGFMFKDTDIFNIKDEECTINNYSKFEQPNVYKFEVERKGNEVLLKSVDDSLKDSEEITLPEFVTEIDDGVFKEWRKLKRINLENIKRISEEAFMGTGLEEVIAPSLLEVKPFAFNLCKKLTKVVMPAVKSIKYKTFENCQDLKYIELSECKDIEDYAFSNCYKLEFNKEVLNMKLHQLAFNNCRNYEVATEEKLNIKGDTVTGFKNKIGTVLNIREVILPERVKKVSDRAFFNGNFAKINIENVHMIGEDAFAFCHLLKAVDMRNVKEIGNGAFYDCSKLKSLGDISGVKEIPASCFAFCYSLKEIDLTGVERIGSFAFADCGFTAVDLKTVRKVENNAFESCKQLKTIDLRNVESVGEKLFNECKLMETILINGDINGYNTVYKVEGGKKLVTRKNNKVILSIE